MSSNSAYPAVVVVVSHALDYLAFSYVNGAQNISVGLKSFKSLNLRPGEKILVYTDKPGVGGTVEKITRA